jgi:hypothetical protein
LGATLKLTVPGPMPLAPLVIESQLDSARAVQEHWLADETATDPDPPGEPNDRDVADNV